MMRSRTVQGLTGTLFWILFAALIAANALVMWHSLTVLRFWEDEAFNLTVPRNLLAGLGYTSDGTLSGSTLTPFDPRISTGPVVLLPVAALLATGIDPVIGARLVPLAYWVLLLVGVGVIGRRLAGRFGALIAVALPLAFDTAGSVSPIQGPADLLGEIPAAALIVWALVVLPRRAWPAGLLLGLAVQAKLIALLALPAFAVALFLLTPPGPFRARVVATLRRGILPLVLVAAPTVLVELAALVSLGPSGYVEHLRGLVGFVRSGGQHYQPTTVPEKLSTLAGAWFVPGWLVALAVVLAAAVVVLAALPWRDRDPQLLALGFGSAVGLLAFVGWWAQAAQLPLWVRHPAVGVFAFAPILAALAVRAAGALWRRYGPQEAAGRSDGRPALTIPVRAVAVVSAAVLTVVVAGGALGDAARTLRPPNTQTLAEQRAAAAPIAAWVRQNGVDWLAAQPWGPPVSYVVLSGAHAGLFDAPAMRNTRILILGPCPGGSPLATSPGISVCPAP
ncbi:hypothetical protein [Microbacterium capsulatum]|uniref:DUF2029 domain-containing protein n=1 Tax=Microbacterium capsulatum TaxID=3041921 RepID=A0ABU0XGH2_9MICO|nr:hypothetical protein [Microbacterium sp. ASV81]MDQ4214223.1 hypothetical protein [Microbacterium sp. ASV81]